MLQPETAPVSQTSLPVSATFDWRLVSFVTISACVLLLLMFWQTSYSMVEIWYRSETFAHGFFIFPITIWLIWRKRHDIAALTPSINGWGLPILFVLGFVWFIADAVDINVVRQAALIAMLPVTVFTLLGWRVTWTIAFPLVFLMFAVPVGEGLIPPLMEFTADFTVGMVQLTGIPVYREGTFFELPSGNWSVVEGCSGVRYLIASVTLGCLYAYLTYVSYVKRTLFIIFAIVMPIIANGMRAFIIVMLGHFSDMKVATGADHLVYGWVFFGIVIAIMFFIGSFWREDEEPASDEENNSQKTSKPTSFARKPFLISVLGVLTITAIWPVGAVVRNMESHADLSISLVTPESSMWQKSQENLTEWQPRYVGTDAELTQTYERDNTKISLYMGYYVKQRQDKELVNTQNYLIQQKHEIWAQKGEGTQTLDLNGAPVVIRDAILRSVKQSLYVQYWYWLNGEYTSSPTKAKLLEAKSILTGGDKAVAVIVVTTEMESTIIPAKEKTKKFIKDMLPAIEKSLQQANGD